MIRKAMKADASRLAEILIFTKRMSYRKIFNDDYVSFNEMQVLNLAMHYQNDKNALNNVYVYDDGIIKGMMSIDTENNSAWKLEELYVDTFFQNEGIGSKLINEFLSKAKQNNVKIVSLYVLKENIKAIKFYESKFGFHSDNTELLYPNSNAVLLKYVKEI